MRLIILVASFLALATSGPTVTTSLGAIEGFDYTTKSGSPSEIFLGINYAKKPNRFERAVGVDPWSSTLNATEFGPVCYPHTREAMLNYPTSEDCLSLNIFRPKITNSSASLPVLIWIHGGGFEIGSARQFGYTGFADNYNPVGIIVVTLQYRVGVHGFLTDVPDGLKGNFGFWDQALAIKFIKQHIGSFGGDPSKMTVWGLSAGGSSANLLVLSPITRDDIQGSIEMSGSAFSAWGMGPTVQQNSIQLIQQLGCTSNVLQCLQAKTVDQIFDAVEVVGYTKDMLDYIKWGPVVDGEFFPKAAELLAAEAPPKPSIVGVGNKDAGYFAILGYSPYIQNLSLPAAEQPSFDDKKFAEIVHRIVPPTYFKGNTQQAIERIIDRYAPPNQTNGFYLNSYQIFMSSIGLFVPAVDSIIARNKAGWDTYAYRFDQYNDVIWTQKQPVPKEVWGSVHVNEYSYMFDLFPIGKFDMVGNDGLTHTALVSAIESFTKTGKPTLPGVMWEKTGNDMNYLVFEGAGRMERGYFADEYMFACQLRSLGFDLSTLRQTRPA